MDSLATLAAAHQKHAAATTQALPLINVSSNERHALPGACCCNAIFLACGPSDYYSATLSIPMSSNGSLYLLKLHAKVVRILVG